MKRDSISVAVCTYNGAEFLRQQLDSVSQQTRLPDQVLIRDDRSKDGSVSIAKEWAEAVPFEVLVEVNPENLGSTRNFIHAIKDIQGDLIVLSDQDDIWMTDKLEKIERCFTKDADAEALFTDAWVADAALNKLCLWSEKVKIPGASIQREIDSGKFLRRLTVGNLPAGATMALRAGLREKLLPMPERLPSRILHDGWITLAAAVRGTLRYLDIPLILYRQHPAQIVGLEQSRLARSPNDREAILASLAQESQMISEALHARFPENRQTLLPFSEMAAHRAFRSNRSPSLPGRILPVLTRLARGNYHRYGEGWRNAIGDLLH